ncbi:MAG: AraC family transcriptional regulator [Thermoleophilia bacterium]
MIEVAGPHRTAELLESVGLPEDPGTAGWAGESIDAATYYDLIERIVGSDDPGFPLRYARALQPDDLGALGLALKTAPGVGAALRRLSRYVMVLSDTLEYRLDEAPGGGALTLNGRSHHRPGAALANECALAAIVSILRTITGTELAPHAVMFRHQPPPSDRYHREFFGGPVTFGAPVDGLRLDDAQLARPTLLADEGLSQYLLAQLDDLKARSGERSIVEAVRAAVADALPDGQPSKSSVARRLGMSERTLHRHLAERGETFQALATDARRAAAESLLRSGGTTLTDVAFLTGFSDQTAFSRAFKRWTGRTPAAYRAEHA